jgi:acetolactate synthase-1/2/3 large subunit
MDYVKIAEGFGLRGFRVERPERLGEVLRAALQDAQPAFIDVVTAPESAEVPPVRSWVRALEGT